MTQKEQVSLERIDQKLDDLIESFKEVKTSVKCHDKEIATAKGWAVGASVVVGAAWALVSHIWRVK